MPEISVGIIHANKIYFSLDGKFNDKNGLEIKPGKHCLAVAEGIITIDGKVINTLPNLSPKNDKCRFTLHDVVIGIGFHWEQKEDQLFKGALSFVLEGGKLWAVNTLSIEDYLFCVIASEMKSTSSLELLKAHAVVSRSWLMAQIEAKKKPKTQYRSASINAGTLIKWYDREDHTLFDVCADDHCQRYQGLTRANNKSVKRAIEETAGQLLVYEGEICDARFSKCCGGMTEVFETCWQPTHIDYLQSFVDNTVRPEGTHDWDLTTEEGAKNWITTSPEAYCDTTDAEILKQVLNDYDVKTTPKMYRWVVEYSQQEISDLIEEKSALGIGILQDMEVVERGPSGRIVQLKLIGSNKSVTIGKELEIRRTLSKSHLQSSAFVVDRNLQGKFIIRGAGWGHGVGMCQVGAAVMAHRQFSYKGILYHYFRRATIEKRW
ncbi:MAG: SpoIID/LytB domain-containing protein [Bacteroidia bacterium]|nr:SpoIID/LytB domain-containing protein [Bacteroidia bacterium]